MSVAFRRDSDEEHLEPKFAVPIPPGPMSLSEISHAAGPRITTNSTGRMNKINGMVMIAGRRAAFSSARIMRSLRNSADSTRSADASGVP